MEDEHLVGPVDAGKTLSEVIQIRLRDPDAEGPYLGVLVHFGLLLLGLRVPVISP
jgi:hypothetical protein